MASQTARLLRNGVLLCGQANNRHEKSHQQGLTGPALSWGHSVIGNLEVNLIIKFLRKFCKIQAACSQPVNFPFTDLYCPLAALIFSSRCILARPSREAKAQFVLQGGTNRRQKGSHPSFTSREEDPEADGDPGTMEPPGTMESPKARSGFLASPREIDTVLDLDVLSASYQAFSPGLDP